MKKDQMALYEEIAREIEAEEQAELERIQKERATQEEASKAAIYEEWDNEQAMIEADYEKKFFAAQRAEAIRNKPPTKTQRRNQMIQYLKNMAGYSYAQLKDKSFDEVQKLFEKHMKWINSFVPMEEDLPSEKKRAKDKQEQESSKRQRVEDDKEEKELKKCFELAKEEEIAINAIPLATKVPVVVKAKHGDNRPEEDFERVLWGDLRVMFKPNVESEVWRSLQGYKRYPLTPIIITNMLIKKLQADQWNEMVYQLLKLMVMLADYYARRVIMSEDKDKTKERDQARIVSCYSKKQLKKESKLQSSSKGDPDLNQNQIRQEYDDISHVREIIVVDERLWNPSGSQTPDREWNKTKTVDDRPPQSWMTQLAQASGTQSSFNEFLATPIDFSAFIMNRLKLNNLTQDVLTGPTYDLMKGTCKSVVELEYHLEEVFKATNDQLDWHNPEGRPYPHDLSKPLPLIQNARGRQVIPFDHFINNDLEYLKGGSLSQKYTTSLTKTKSANYCHVKWIEDKVPRSIWSPEQVIYDKYAYWGTYHWGPKRQRFYG
ncbi:hypothetical protein Tco_0418218 [Tanacetum coccineum]